MKLANGVVVKAAESHEARTWKNSPRAIFVPRERPIASDRHQLTVSESAARCPKAAVDSGILDPTLSRHLL